MTNGFAQILRRLSFLLLVLLAVVAVPSLAAAQSAEADFVKAQEAYDKGNYSDALEGFRKAFAASGSPNARIYVGRALAKLRRYAEAYAEMQATVRDATKLAEQEDRYAETRNAAAGELALLEPKVGKLVIALADEHADAEVELNGESLSSDRLGVPLPVEPGTALIEATLTGTDGVRREVEVQGGETKTVTLTFGNEAPEEEEEEEEDSGALLSVVQGLGIGVTVLGVGGLVAFAVTASAAKSKFNQLEDECAGLRCSGGAKYEEVIDDGKQMETVANVTAVVGGVLLAAGLAMIIFGGDSETEGEADAALHLGPLHLRDVGAAPLEGGGVLQLGGSF